MVQATGLRCRNRGENFKEGGVPGSRRQKQKVRKEKPFSVQSRPSRHLGPCFFVAGFLSRPFSQPEVNVYFESGPLVFKIGMRNDNHLILIPMTVI